MVRMRSTRGQIALAVLVAAVLGAAIGASPTTLVAPHQAAGTSSSRSVSPAPSAPTPAPTTAEGAATVAPWAAPTDVAERARLAGLALGPAQERVHIHAHLTVTVHGTAVVVPKHLGIARVDGRTVYSPLHTHDTSGIVHIESAVRSRFTLAQVFTEWDVALGDGTVGAYGATGGDTVTVFVNGEPHVGDPGAIVLRNLQNIDIVVVPTGQTAVPPGGFYWPSNY